MKRFGSRPSRFPALGLPLSLCALLSSCGADFPPPSQLDGLRVLAVRAEPASGAPGRAVSLEMLMVDESIEREAPIAPVQIAWLGGCHNPPSRQFFACYPLARLLSEHLAPEVLATDTSQFPAGVFGTGNEFRFTVPENILEAAPRIETDPIHFGVSYVFFAACRGQLRARPDLMDRVPLDCIDPETGTPLGASAFVSGFSTLFSYEGLDNQNPVLQGLSLDGVPVTPTPCQSDAECAPLSSAAQGRFEAACSSRATCAPVIAPCPASGACPFLRVAPDVHPASAEALEGATEILWANYYSAGGRFETPTQLVSDRATGLIADPSARWHPPRRTLESLRLWVTLHDQRGGTAWSFLDVVVREPETP